jgi:hypothetical protein
MISRTSHADASLASSLELLKNPHVVRADIRPLARREIIPHAALCWNCSRRLQDCDEAGKSCNGSEIRARHWKGPCLAWIAKIDGYDRRLHATCAEELGFRAERP